MDANGRGHDGDDGEKDLRGHNPVKVLQLSGIRSGWRCTICRKSSSKKEFLISRRCRGSPIVEWSRVEQDSDDDAQPAPMQQHRKMLSGSVLWCFRCGTYADKNAKGLNDSCKGKPPRQLHRGGMEGELRKLRNGIHPKTGAVMPPPMELDPSPGRRRPRPERKSTSCPRGSTSTNRASLSLPLPVVIQKVMLVRIDVRQCSTASGPRSGRTRCETVRMRLRPYCGLMPRPTADCLVVQAVGPTVVCRRFRLPSIRVVGLRSLGRARNTILAAKPG